MKRTLYIQDRSLKNKKYDTYYTVDYTSYREGLSIDAFRNLNLDVPFKLKSLLKTLDVYIYLYTVLIIKMILILNVACIMSI